MTGLANAKEACYFCEISEEGNLKLHSLGQDSPIIATADKCLVIPGATDIHLTSPKLTLQLEHPHKRHSHCQSNFKFNGKGFAWDGHNELFERGTGKVLARFYPSWHIMDESEHQIGKLVIPEAVKSMEVLIVMTAFIVLERSEEGQEAVLCPR